MSHGAATSGPVLLYDGECGFCAGSVQFLLRHESGGSAAPVRFAPLQGRFGATVRAQHPELAEVDSVVWFDAGAPSGERVLVRSAAALAAMHTMGRGWALLASLGRLVPRALRDPVYNAIARRRLDIAAPACLLPTPAQRARFLD